VVPIMDLAMATGSRDRPWTTERESAGRAEAKAPSRATERRRGGPPLPDWVPPQLSKLVTAAPEGDAWAHEIKYDGYRMHARFDRGEVFLLTRTGLDWTENYPAIVTALRALPARQAYLDGELCAVRPDGTSSFSLTQNAHSGRARLVFYAFDLLHLDRVDLMPEPLAVRKQRLEELLAGMPAAIEYSGHIVGQGARFHAEACRLGLEGIVSKRLDAPYRPGDRGLWRKTKCVNREEFVVVGWTDPEGGRPKIGALLLTYYAPDGRLVYAGRAGTGLSDAELGRVWRRLQLIATKMPLDVAPPRTSRFGSPLVLSRVHWVRPEMVIEVSYMNWTDDGLLRHVVYQGERRDKPAADVRRELPGAVLPSKGQRKKK
jgi:DNA ligase D-like protein (predicted ligase)